MISVIMPLYNNEKYIEEAVKSVINQTYTDWELLIINDASTDNSFQIVEKIAKTDSRIKLINFKKNKGVSHARNLGIREAKGEYISFLDSDDFWNKDFLNALYYKLKLTNNKLGYATSYYFYTNNDKKINPNLSKTKINEFITKKKHRYEINYPFFIDSIMIKKTLITEYNIFFPEKQTLFEDLLFVTKLLCITDMTFEATSISYYRQHSESATHQKYTTNDFLQELTYLVELNKFASKHKKNIELLSELLTYRTYRVINSILKSGDIANTLSNIKKYQPILKEFCNNNYFKLNDRFKCKIFLLQNKFILNLLKYL